MEICNQFFYILKKKMEIGFLQNIEKKSINKFVFIEVLVKY